MLCEVVRLLILLHLVVGNLLLALVDLNVALAFLSILWELLLQVQLVHHLLWVFHIIFFIIFACLVTDFGNFVIELPLLFQIAVLVVVGLAFEVRAFSILHGLPCAAYLLHDFKRTHVWISINNLRSCLKTRNKSVNKIRLKIANSINFQNFAVT